MTLDIYMNEAIKEAKKAYNMGEIPIGAIVVYEGKIIGKGYNNVEKSNHSFEHAEILAIKEAQDFLGTWRLDNATLFTTLEPCIMCSGAIIHSRISKLVYGAKDIQRGFAGSVLNILDDKIFNHKVEVISEIKEHECSELILNFFNKRREEKRRIK